MTTETIGLLYMLADAGPVVKFVMLVLLFFSIITWAIIFIKFRYFRKAFHDTVDLQTSSGSAELWQMRLPRPRP